MLTPTTIAAMPVVAFTHVAAGSGEPVSKGVAITQRGDRFNVHTVWLHGPDRNRWEGMNGRYEMTWPAALAELVDRATDAPPPPPDHTPKAATR